MSKSTARACAHTPLWQLNWPTEQSSVFPVAALIKGAVTVIGVIALLLLVLLLYCYWSYCSTVIGLIALLLLVLLLYCYWSYCSTIISVVALLLLVLLLYCYWCYCSTIIVLCEVLLVVFNTLPTLVIFANRSEDKCLQCYSNNDLDNYAVKICIAIMTQNVFQDLLASNIITCWN